MLLFPFDLLDFLFFLFYLENLTLHYIEVANLRCKYCQFKILTFNYYYYFAKKGKREKKANIFFAGRAHIESTMGIHFFLLGVAIIHFLFQGLNNRGQERKQL